MNNMDGSLKPLEVLNNDALRSTIKKHNDYIGEYKNAGFNVFNLISDMYHRENLHSDIIAAFLDTNGSHNEGDRFLKVFLDLLKRIKTQTNQSLDINDKDFMDTEVERESIRIDILVKDAKTKKAIIIENKINNASDTLRQLPTYVEKIGWENVVAIVYLPLNLTKKPDKKEWTREEEEFIESKLIILPVYNGSNNDFYKGWLQKCIDESSKEDSKAILKQYSKLIFNLGGLQMNDDSLKDLYDEIQKPKNEIWKSMVSLKEIMDKALPSYRAKRIYEKYIGEKEISPFTKLVLGDDKITISFLGYTFEKRTFKIHIKCILEKSELKFYDEGYDAIENDQTVNIKYASKIIEGLKKSNVSFKEKKTDEYVNVFSFPDKEKDLYDFIDNLKEALKEIQKG